MEILTTKEVCELLRMQRQSLYTMVKDGEIPAFRMGRSWKFERGSIEAWIKKKLEADKENRQCNTVLHLDRANQ